MYGTDIYHLNDRTMKYLSMAQAKRQHQYLGLPGNFKTRLPQEVVFPNMDIGRADEYYLTDNDLLINLLFLNSFPRNIFCRLSKH